MSSVGAMAAITASAAAARKRREEKEEEAMAGYNSNDLTGWEFKIVRSGLGKFSSAEAVRKLCEEEARSGWEMLEKFDSGRIRFKRRVENRAADVQRDTDPYRTEAGAFGGKVSAIVIGLLLALGGAVFLYLNMSDSGLRTESLPMILIAIIAVVALVAVVWAKLSRS